MWSFSELHRKNVLRINKYSLEFVQYFVVASIAFIVDFYILFVLTEYYGVNYLISNIFSFIIGLLINYTLSTIWVFSYRKIKDRKKEFIYFFIIGLVGLSIGQLFLWLFTILGLYYMYSKLIATGIVFIWNFIVRKKLLFT